MSENNDTPPPEETLPSTTKELVEFLDRKIPESCPNLKMEPKEIWFYAGQRHVVNVLKVLLNRPTEE